MVFQNLDESILFAFPDIDQRRPIAEAFVTIGKAIEQAQMLLVTALALSHVPERTKP